jgi:hypothetical protein
MRALERANEVRLARAELKRSVAFGEIDVAEVILHCPWEADSMAVADLLVSQRHWGQTRCRRLLAQVPMSEQKTVGSMTERQRHALSAMLGSADADRAQCDPLVTDGVPGHIARRDVRACENGLRRTSTSHAGAPV